MHTNGTEWLNNLPNLPGPTRDKMILEAAESGLLISEWSIVRSKIPDYEAIFSVTSDALYVTLEDGSRFRPPCSAQLQQQCADVFTASLPTPKIMDMSYIQASVKLDCVSLPAGAKMSTIDYSKLYNKEFEKRRAGRDGLIRDSGKSWVLSNRLGESKTIAINHGFYSKSGPSVSGGVKLYQSVGGRHNALHTDYSQLIQLVSSQCLLNNETVEIVDLMKHPILCKLLSYEYLKFSRQPGF